MNYFPKNLRYLRQKRGLNQADMHQHVNITRTTWSNYEIGFTNPKINELINISKFFGVSLDDLILTDLELEDPLPQKKRRKPKPYPLGQTITIVAEPAVSYLLQEFNKLKAEVNSMKEKQK
jgi:transcriptional regulator with XRE-family HTH domain